MKLRHIRKRAQRRQALTAVVWLEFEEWNGSRCYVIPNRVFKLKHPARCRWRAVTRDVPPAGTPLLIQYNVKMFPV